MIFLAILKRKHPSPCLRHVPLFLDSSGPLGCHLASPTLVLLPSSNYPALCPSPTAYTVAYKSPILSVSHKHTHTHTHTHTQGYFPLPSCLFLLASQSSLYRPFIVPFSAPLPPGFTPWPPGCNKYPSFVHLLSPLMLNDAPFSYSAIVTSQPLILPLQSPAHPSLEDTTPPLPFDLSLKIVNDFPPPAE